MTPAPILVAGRWQPAAVADTFQAIDPRCGAPHPTLWPVSAWSDVDAALEAAGAAAAALRQVSGATLARFLECYAERLEARSTELVAVAQAETGLPLHPRLVDNELPRMLNQLRQAAAAAREGSWRTAVIDTQHNIRSLAVGLGPVVVLPPANFPLAYGAVTGGDFAAAIAAGNPVIAKAHPGHPGVSRLAAEEALAALAATGLPAATVQLLHGLSPADGERLVADRRVGATGFTGSQEVGRRLHLAAAATGRVIWLEMGSINPVVVLPGALADRADQLATELAASVTGSAGQLCTKPGLIFFVDDGAAKNAAGAFVEALAGHLRAMGVQVLLGPTARDRLAAAVAGLQRAGAQLHAGGEMASGPCECAATLLEVTAARVLAAPEQLIREAFGNATLLVRCTDLEELARVLEAVPGALVAGLHSTPAEADSASRFAAILLERTGRLVENRMTTGMTLSPAMHHGGPWPSASPPFFSAVGLPLSILRFARRVCYDGASQQILPEALRDAAPEGSPWRQIDGQWRRA